MVGADGIRPILNERGLRRWVVGAKYFLPLRDIFLPGNPENPVLFNITLFLLCFIFLENV